MMSDMQNAVLIPEETLRRIADVFGRHGAAGVALRQGASLRALGEPIAYYRTSNAIVAVSTQGQLPL